MREAVVAVSEVLVSSRLAVVPLRKYSIPLRRHSAYSVFTMQLANPFFDRFLPRQHTNFRVAPRICTTFGNDSTRQALPTKISHPDLKVHKAAFVTGIG
jgi:hypothetical protein